MGKKKEKDTRMHRFSVMYHNTRIWIPYPRNPRIGVCVSCKRSKQKKEIKTTQLHHTWYEFLTETVRKNPLLALKNTLECCYPCHLIADGFRNILDKTSMTRIMMVVKMLPKFQLKKLVEFCHKFLDWWEREGRNL
jgi:hypothetical protein